METVDEIDWDRLLKRIRDKRCTPFVGAGASASFLPVGSQIAKEWAEATRYPLPDVTDLARVAQYLAVTEDPMWPKEQISERLAKALIPATTSPDDPHQILAALELPIYVTTNYDGLMARALRERGKDVKEGICRWNQEIAEELPEEFTLPPDYEPTPDAPLVYHLHGHLELPESLVLTEDDYIDFLIRISRDETLLPVYVRKAFTGASVLFVGYRIADTNFRVLFRSLVIYMQESLKRSHFSVQSSPKDDEFADEAKQRAKDYLVRYFDLQRISVFWGYSQDFAQELGKRWQSASDGG
jgi:SIR2-like domain